MARIIRGARLDSREARSQLKVQAEPHWLKMTKGCYLGYRKTSSQRGNWIARFFDRTGKKLYHALGAADDALDADGQTALSFEQAQAKARNWFQTTAARGDDMPWGGKLTVAKVIERYLSYIKAHKKSHRHLDTYCNAYILPKLGKIDCTDLTTTMVRSWHEGIAKEPPRLRAKKNAKQIRYREEDKNEAEARRKRQLRANRHLTTLKAALNLAWRDGLIAHNDAWSRVQPFPGVERQRTRFLNPDEAQRLINTCEPDLRELVQAALLTGARYGELCALEVRDVNRMSESLHIRDSKSGKSRHIYLNEEGIDFFTSLVAGRRPTELVLRKSDGTPWARDLHARVFRAAVARAGIENGFTFHELRHTWASLTIMAGAPLMVVAQNLGHRDTRMVELHYGHLAEGYVRDVLRRTAPSFNTSPSKLKLIAKR